MTTLTSAAPEIDRDRWGRPLVAPPGGGKRVAYTRCTTFIDCIEDKFGLQKWMQRMVAVGLSQRPDLQLAVSAHADDKRELDRICDAAREAATASAAATTGTALHALTELVDRGQDLPVLPDAAKADLDAYRDATAELTAVNIEQFCVLDALKIGGTPDRVVKYGGKRYIADIKTGSIEYGILKIAAQLAVYARSHTYDIKTGVRGEHGAELDKGVIIHLPAGQGRCELVWVDLLAGWEAVKVARRVREQRALKFKDLATPWGQEPEPAPESTPEPEVDLAALIADASTPDAVRLIWSRHNDRWDDALTEAAKARVAELEAAS